MEYINPLSGQKVKYTQQQLDTNEALGFLSSQFRPVETAAPAPTPTTKIMATGPTVVNTLKPEVGINGQAQAPVVAKTPAQQANEAFTKSQTDSRYAKPIVMPDGTVRVAQEASADTKAVSLVGAKDRKLSPEEFTKLRTTLGVSEANFDNYFLRQGSDIYLKGDPLSALNGDKPLSPEQFTRLRTQLGVSPDNFDDFFKKVGNDIYMKPGVMIGGAPAFNAGISESTTTFSPDDLTAPELTFPDVTPTNDFDAFVKSLEKMYEMTQSDRQKALEEENNQLRENLKTDLAELEKKGDRTLELEGQQGIPEKMKALEELNLQIAQKNSEFNQLITNIEDQPIGMDYIRGQKNRAIETQAVVIGSLQAQAAAIKGNLDLAYQLVDRTIDLEFAGVEQRIANAKEMLNLNDESLSEEEKKQAFKMEQILSFRSEVIAQQKEERTLNRDLMLLVAKAGGDPRTIDLQGSYDENLMNAAPTLLAMEEAEARVGNTVLTTVNGRRVLVDKRDGSIVADVGASAAGRSGGGSSGGGTRTTTPGTPNAQEKALGLVEYNPEDYDAFVDLYKKSGSDDAYANQRAKELLENRAIQTAKLRIPGLTNSQVQKLIASGTIFGSTDDQLRVLYPKLMEETGNGSGSLEGSSEYDDIIP